MPDIVEANNIAEENAAFAAGAKIVIRTDLLPPPPPPPPDYEELSSYIQVDPSNVLDTTYTKLTFTSQSRAMIDYCYKDFGADHFSGNFSFDFEYKITGHNSGGVNPQAAFIALNNTLGSYSAVLAAKGNIQCILGGRATAPFIAIHECAAGILYNSAFFTPALNVNYYMTFSRDMSVGAHGILTLKIFSDASRTRLVATLTLALHKQVAFRYLLAIQSVNSGHPTAVMSGVVDHLVIG
jgi:hypothetical protein